MGYSNAPYMLDQEEKIVHRSDCEKIASKFRSMIGCEKLANAVKKGYQPCECCREDFEQAEKERRLDILDRVQYRYLYGDDSQIFHLKGCPCLAQIKTIRGTEKYATVLKTGRRPCQRCHPERIGEQELAEGEKKRERPVKNTVLTKAEKRAVKRYEAAKKERSSGSLKGRTHDDQVELTATGKAFWAAKGYSNFHLRSCPKLQDLTDLVGFSRYQEAMAAGYKPCRTCHPAPKLNLDITMPITSQERDQDTPEMLERLCREKKYSYRQGHSIIELETPVGKWKIFFRERPVRLEHVNLAFSDPDTNYHVQPRIFLSLLDAFQYIERHDQKLETEVGPTSREDG